MKGLNADTSFRGADIVAGLFHRNVSADERRELAKKGAAMPGDRFPIANAEDLKSAIRLAKTDAERRHCIKRARALNLSDRIPENWNSDGTVKHFETFGDFLTHYGVKGMKWGQRKAERSQRIAENVSPDAKEAIAARQKAKDLTVSSLSNDEIKSAVSRIKLEQEFSRLTYEPSKLQKGYNTVKKMLGIADTANRAVSATKGPAAQAVAAQIKKQRAAPA